MSEPTETDLRTAAELGIPVEEIVRIWDVWMRHARDVAREKAVAKEHEHDNCVEGNECLVSPYQCHCSLGARHILHKLGDVPEAHSHK